MGQVFMAHDARLRHDLAIKVLSESIARGSAWERFEREARAAEARATTQLAGFETNSRPGNQNL